MGDAMARYNNRIAPRFIVLSKPYLVSNEKWFARGLITLLVMLLLANTAASVLLNQQTGEFSSALAARDSDRYWQSIYYTFGLLVVAVPIYGFYYYVRDSSCPFSADFFEDCWQVELLEL